MTWLYVPSISAATDSSLSAPALHGNCSPLEVDGVSHDGSCHA
jgi:hypothetical protein